MKYDCLIIGGGPAGITAAINLKRAKLNIRVFESAMIGGKLPTLMHLHNFAGFASGNGVDLALSMVQQLEQLEVPVSEVKVKGLYLDPAGFKLIDEDNSEYLAKTVIVASGTYNGFLNIKGEEAYKNRGLSGCAVCDGHLYKNKVVGIMSDDESDIAYLSALVKKLYVINTKFEVKKYDNCESLNNITITKLLGKPNLSGIEYLSSDKTPVTKTLDMDALFVSNRLKPSTEFIFIPNVKNKNNFLIVDKNTQLTPVPNLYACGDVCNPRFRQVAIAMGEGSLASLEIIDAHYKKA
jgi:thioredoxin reductase (NADPH)